MSFRKRNVVISNAQTGRSAAEPRHENTLSPGVRPSPLDGRLTTSTGTASLDHLLAGHVGLPLGNSLLVEEQGTTDFAGVLLRYYAAEGLVQGHQVRVLGFSEVWRHELPALAATPDEKSRAETQGTPQGGKMKIAWRYEALGNQVSADSRGGKDASQNVYCHSFDLTKRLASGSIKGSLKSTSTSMPSGSRLGTAKSVSPLRAFAQSLREELKSSPPATIFRIVVPSLLSPTLYTLGTSQPSEVLQFLHTIRGLLRTYNTQLTALITLPVSLYPRSTGLTRWMELLCDGVVELIPLPANPAAPPPGGAGGNSSENWGQGLLKVHSLPVYHEKGGGGANQSLENLTFSLSSSKGLVIKPFSLPPLGEGTHEETNPSSTIKDGMDF